MSAYVPPEVFVARWTENPTLGEAADAIGWTKPMASQAALSLRKLGVKLKRMPRTAGVKRPDWNAHNINVDRLNAIIDGEPYKEDWQEKAEEAGWTAPRDSGSA